MFYSRSKIDELFNQLISEPTYYYRSSYISDDNKSSDKYEINQTKDGGYLFFEAPGFNKQNLNVDLEDGVLHVHGKRTYKLNGEDVEKKINKKFNIGTDYDTSSVEATIEDGILTVFIPNYKKKDKKRLSLH